MQTLKANRVVRLSKARAERPSLVEWIVAFALAATMTAGKRYTGWRWKRVSAFVRKRDRFRCRVCKSRELLHVHHVKHVSRGGSHYPTNLIALCVSCHEREHGFDINGDGKF